MGQNKSTTRSKKKLSTDDLRNTVFYFALGEEELEKIHDAFTVENHKTGKVIISAGDKCYNYYVVLKGEVNVMYNDAPLCTKEKGNYFGVDSQNLVAGNPIISDCTFVTSGKTSLLCLTPEDLKKFLETVEPPPTPTRISDILTSNLASESILEKIPWLNDIESGTRDLLRHMLACEVYEPHQEIVKEGSVGNDMYIVCHGKLKAVSHVQMPGVNPRLRRLTDPESKEIHLNDFHPGDYFGEIGLACKMPRTADVVNCEEKSLLLCLKRQDFDNFFALVPQFKEPFDEMVVRRTAESFRKYKIPFFDSIPMEKYQILAPLCRIMNLGPKTRIFAEDDQGHSFYIMAYGTVSVSTRNNGQITTLGPGKYFGELALTSVATKRRATVTTISKCILLTFQKQEFDTFLEQVPEAASDFHTKVVNDVSFGMLLHHEIGLQCFTKFLESEYSDENIKFWTAVQKFKKLDDAEKDLREEAQEIVDKYLNDDSEDGQVNVSFVTKEALLKALESEEKIGNDVFEATEKAVFSLMSNDSFQRFKQSDLMQEFMQQSEENAGKI